MGEGAIRGERSVAHPPANAPSTVAHCSGVIAAAPPRESGGGTADVPNVAGPNVSEVPVEDAAGEPLLAA